jgi:hypothetical protein
MAQYEERRTVAEDIPVGRRPVVETQHEAIIHERRGMSGAAVAALVIAAIAAAVLITMMIINSNQQSREAELEMERDRARNDAARAAGQPATPPTPSQPQVVVVPQPVPVPVPGSPAPAPSASSAPAVSDASIEIDVTTKLLDDQELRKHPVEVKFSGGTATLTGSVPSEDLKALAEKVAKTVKGVSRVVNNITVSNR